MMSNAGVRIKELTVEHATPAGPLLAVDRIDLDIERGSLVGIMGPSGCGKSTLLGVLAGLAGPTSGTVHIGTTDITSLGPADRTAFRKRNIGVVYQADNLLPFLTVTENVRLQLALAGGRDSRGDKKHAAARTTALLDQLGLLDLADRLPDQLSGGQRQRAAVARAIVHRPHLLLADEPTGALDADNAEAVLQLLTNANRDLGATVVMVTHDPGVARRMDRVVQLRDGALFTDSEAFT